MCVDIVLYCYYTPHAHTPHIVLLCAVCQTWSNSYRVEPDVLELSVLPLFITFPSPIYVAVVQGLASFSHQGPGGKYFGLWGLIRALFHIPFYSCFGSVFRVLAPFNGMKTILGSRARQTHCSGSFTLTAREHPLPSKDYGALYSPINRHMGII